MTEQQIVQIWSQINQILELESGKFNIKLLCTRQWYLEVLQIIFPFLSSKLLKINDIQSEEAAIDRLLLLLAQEDIIEDDFLEIKGKDIVAAHHESIFYVVQLFMALVDKALQEAEENGELNDEEEQEGHEDESHSKFQSSPKKQKQSEQFQREDERECHSVQGIGNQFQKDQNEEDDEDQHFHQNYDLSQKDKNFKNVFPNKSQPSPPKQLKEINYKNYNDDDNEKNYLQQKLQKNKSEELFKNISSKKSPKAMDIQAQKVRKLIAHPQIPKQYPKANTIQEKKLTKQVKKTVAVSRKHINNNENGALRRVTSAEQLQLKKRELHRCLANSRKDIRYDTQTKKINALKEKNQQKLKKLLKWKQANLRRQKQELEQDMEMKVQLKKELYVKKINKLILALERSRIVDKKKDEREREKKEKELAVRRLQAIQQQYKIQMKLLHEKSQEKVGKKAFSHTDHRTIIEGLERELKKENEKQLLGLKMRLRREEAQLEDDLQKLQSEIVKAYKRN